MKNIIVWAFAIVTITLLGYLYYNPTVHIAGEKINGYIHGGYSSLRVLHKIDLKGWTPKLTDIYRTETILKKCFNNIKTASSPELSEYFRNYYGNFDEKGNKYIWVDMVKISSAEKYDKSFELENKTEQIAKISVNLKSWQCINASFDNPAVQFSGK